MIFRAVGRQGARRAAPAAVDDHADAVAGAQSDVQGAGARLGLLAGDDDVGDQPRSTTACSATRCCRRPTSSSTRPTGVPVGVDQVPHLETHARDRPPLQPPLRRGASGAGGAAHRGAEDPRHRRPQDEQELQQRRLPDRHAGGHRRQARAHGDRPAARAPHRSRASPNDCPAFNLHRIYCTPDEIDVRSPQGCRTAGIGCLDCKKIMIKHVVAELAPIRERRAELERRPDEVAARPRTTATGGPAARPPRRCAKCARPWASAPDGRR